MITNDRTYRWKVQYINGTGGGKMRGPMGRWMFAAVMFVMIVTAATFGQMAIDQANQTQDIDVQPADAERDGVVDANDLEGDVVNNSTEHGNESVIVVTNVERNES